MFPKWLKERGKLVGLLVSDIAAVVVSYNMCFYIGRSEWAYVTGSVVFSTIIFTTSSYVIGRYSFSGESVSRRSIINKGLIACLTTISLLVIATWFVETNDVRAQKEFILPVGFTSLILSICCHCILCRDEIRYRALVYIISDSDREYLIKRELGEAINRYTEIVYSHVISEHLLNSIINYRNTRIVIDNNVKIPNDTLEIILDYRAKGMMLMNISQFFEHELQRLPPEFVTSEWLTGSATVKMMPGYVDWRVKRFIDCCGALVLICITLPVQLMAALCIKIEDGGPVFFSQIRTGLYGKHFRIWKLRSMKTRGNEPSQWSYRGDIRVTRTGKFLRKSRIDELPQLYNVLRGEMSLIGPRPEQPSIEISLEEEILNYRLRHLVRPGITGWAQICYGYGSSIKESRVKLSYDLFYITHGNWLLDLLITFKTIKQVLILGGI